MTAIDGGTGEVENTAVITGHITYTSRTKGKQTVDVPMRWRGAAGPNAPDAERLPACAAGTLDRVLDCSGRR